MHLAHPSAIKKYEGLKYSGDFADAAYLAHLLCLGLLPEGYIFPRELRAIRDLARKRMQLVRCRTTQILSIENILTRKTGARMSSGAIKKMTTEGIEVLRLKDDVTLAMESNRVICQALQQQIDVLEKRLEAQVKLQQGYKLLKTVPGIGQILVTTIMLEAGPVSRFAEVVNFSSYCRCVNSLRENNGKKKGAGNTKNSNKYLAWAFMEAANFALPPLASVSYPGTNLAGLISQITNLSHIQSSFRATASFSNSYNLFCRSQIPFLLRT
jgi:transposase